MTKSSHILPENVGDLSMMNRCDGVGEVTLSPVEGSVHSNDRKSMAEISEIPLNVSVFSNNSSLFSRVKFGDGNDTITEPCYSSPPEMITKGADSTNTSQYSCSSVNDIFLHLISQLTCTSVLGSSSHPGLFRIIAQFFKYHCLLVTCLIEFCHVAENKFAPSNQQALSVAEINGSFLRTIGTQVLTPILPCSEAKFSEWYCNLETGLTTLDLDTSELRKQVFHTNSQSFEA